MTLDKFKQMLKIFELKNISNWKISDFIEYLASTNDINAYFFTKLWLFDNNLKWKDFNACDEDDAKILPIYSSDKNFVNWEQSCEIDTANTIDFDNEKQTFNFIMEYLYYKRFYFQNKAERTQIAFMKKQNLVKEEKVEIQIVDFEMGIEKLGYHIIYQNEETIIQKKVVAYIFLNRTAKSIQMHFNSLLNALCEILLTREIKSIVNNECYFTFYEEDKTNILLKVANYICVMLLVKHLNLQATTNKKEIDNLQKIIASWNLDIYSIQEVLLWITYLLATKLKKIVNEAKKDYREVAKKIEKTKKELQLSS
ncbi:hypothetical protein [Mycoplasma buteonis]|uniref:hypothetical protein n=1 Tax=Mycoplasma buteonis TaxID=171280 RepID=UPI00056185C2|nr:hypothetical protein [Mycoplasma buteonis]